jgi:hypothetical protein
MNLNALNCVKMTNKFVFQIFTTFFIIKMKRTLLELARRAGEGILGDQLDDEGQGRHHAVLSIFIVLFPDFFVFSF